MQMPTRQVTTAAVMGISTDSEERLPDSARGNGISGVPPGQEVPAPHSSSLRHQALTTDHI